MASKSKSRRRVFRASCILAALIIAGSSFAWFSSKDEVTNRLSASANYGVSIVEDFQPPKNFLPGQKVNKDVAVVNTGNVDAFVRTWIDGEMSLVAKTDYQGTGSVDATDGSGATKTNIKSTLSKTDDDQTKLTSINLNWYNGTTYYKELSQKKSENPKNSSTDTDSGTEENNQPAGFSEVQSIQAGGVLVYHGDGAEFYYVLEQATTITGKKVTSGTVAPTATTETYPKGTIVSTDGSSKKDDAGVIIEDNYYGNIDTSEFFPESEGLYLFRRNIKETGASNAVDDYEYTGYYYCNDASNTTTASPESEDKSANDTRTGNPVYLALCYDNTHTQRSDYVLPDDAVETQTGEPAKDEVLPVDLGDVELFTAQEKVLKSYVDGTDVTYTVDGNEVTVIDNTGSAISVGGTDYTYSVNYGGKQYVSNTKSGGYAENDNGSVGASNITVVETAATALKWTYTPYAAAGSETYKIDGYDATKPVSTTTGQPNASYVWKTIANGVTYWSETENGIYYAESDFSAGSLVSSPTAKSVTVVPGAAASGGKLVATYGSGDKQITINVQLANLNNSPDASTAETWSAIEDVSGDDEKWTFYYNNDVEEGASTTKLIDYVELDKSVKDEAFLAFDFDLNVFMESAQVVLSETGVESGDSIVTPWANGTWADGTSANTNYNAATADVNNDGAEIDYITWAKA